MQPNDDRHTLMVADHGVNPAPMTADNNAVATLRRQRGHSSASSAWHDVLIWCGIPVLVVLLIRIVLIGCYVIPSGSMRDTIQPGDRVATSKLAPSIDGLHRGDIIVFDDPSNWLSQEDRGALGGDYLIKRLIGLPGDVVECDGAGEPIRINGVAVDERAYLRDGVEPSAFAFRVEVSAGHVFVMGDNRANSADSRYHQDDSEHGLVPIKNIVGVAVARYWPIARIGTLDSHHDTFADVPFGQHNGN